MKLNLSSWVFGFPSSKLGQTGKRSNEQTDKQTNRQTDIQTNRQTDKCTKGQFNSTCLHSFCNLNPRRINEWIWWNRNRNVRQHIICFAPVSIISSLKSLCNGLDDFYYITLFSFPTIYFSPKKLIIKQTPRDGSASSNPL